MAQSTVNMIYEAYSTSPLPPVTVLENHFERAFMPHSAEPTDVRKQLL